MILSGHEIRQQLGKNIVIDPFEEKHLNPNSYNLTLHHELLTYEEVVLDMRKPNRVRRLSIAPGGFVLNPNQLYLGRTVERTETHNLVPMSRSVTGMTSADEDAISPNVTMPFANACPDAPRIENAVMFVPKSDSRNTVGPSDRPARK